MSSVLQHRAKIVMRLLLTADMATQPHIVDPCHCPQTPTPPALPSSSSPLYTAGLDLIDSCCAGTNVVEGAQAQTPPDLDASAAQHSDDL